MVLIYQTESTSYDWVSVWEGNHPEYTAYSNYSSGIKVNGNTTGKYGGTAKTTVEFDVSGDSVTFGFRSDEVVNEYYGYYAEVTGEAEDIQTKRVSANPVITTYEITFDSDSGTAVESQFVESGETAEEPNALIKEGYRFDGWYNEDEKFDFSTPITKDIILTAKWTILTHNPATAPTCTEAGMVEYWTDGEKYYSDAYGINEIESIEGDDALGHSYGEPVRTWVGYGRAEATFTCVRDEIHKEIVEAEITSEITQVATVNAEGKRVYTAKATFEERDYTDTKEETLDKIAVTHIEAVSPTYTTTGNSDYYKGADGRYYILDNGEYKEIEADSWILPRLSNETKIISNEDGTETTVVSERLDNGEMIETETTVVTDAESGVVTTTEKVTEKDPEGEVLGSTIKETIVEKDDSTNTVKTTETVVNMDADDNKTGSVLTETIVETDDKAKTVKITETVVNMDADDNKTGSVLTETVVETDDEAKTVKTTETTVNMDADDNKTDSKLTETVETPSRISKTETVMDNEDVVIEKTNAITNKETSVSSILKKVGAEVAHVAVEQLSDEAESRTENESKVTLVMTVKQEEETNVADDVKNAVNEATPDDTAVDYLDITVRKETDKGTEDKAVELISETNKVLEIKVPYDMARKENITVYRHHEGELSAFTGLEKLPESGYTDGSFYVDYVNEIIYIYTQKFSTYTIGYIEKSADNTHDNQLSSETEEQGEEESNNNSEAPIKPVGDKSDSSETTTDKSEDSQNNESKADESKAEETKKNVKSVTDVSVKSPQVNMTKAGETTQITVTVSPADATNKNVIFTSSDNNVAIVDGNGRITAIANGTAVITVTTEDGRKTAIVKVTVKIPEVQQGVAQEEKIEITMNAGLKISQTDTRINIEWGKVKEADGYEVYVTYCGKDFRTKPIIIEKNTKTKVKVAKINGRKINLKKNFKVYVAAYKLVDGKRVRLAKTITGHVVGRKNIRYSNAKKITVSKKKYTVDAGKTERIKAKTVLVDKSKRQLGDGHTKEFRYASSNRKIATVDKAGNIKGIAKGTCTVYVYARNGYAKKIKVEVK